MNLKKVVWSDFAIEDLITIKEYIEKDSIKIANSVFQEILISTRDLSQFPKKGRIIPFIDEDFYREYFIASYRIMYKIENTQVIIAGVFHMAKNFEVSDLIERK